MLETVHKHTTSRFSRFLPCADALGITASVICMIHCVALPFLIMLAPAFSSQFMHDDRTHYFLAFFVATFCLLAIIPGYRRHYHKPVLFMMVSGLALVLFATFGCSCCPAASYEIPVITVGNLLVVAAHMRNRRLLACTH